MASVEGSLQMSHARRPSDLENGGGGGGGGPLLRGGDGSGSVFSSESGTPVARAPVEKPKSGGENASRASATVIAIIVLSIFSSVALILVNKAIMKVYKFQFVYTLSFAHFVCMWASLELCARLGLFKGEPAPSHEQGFAVGAMGVGSIAFMNFSLNANTVGTYQMFKLVVIPAVMVIEYAVSRTWKQSARVVGSLVLLLAGVGMATVTDVEVNAVGLWWGALAVAATAQFNIWQGTKQREWKLSSTQLTHTVAPYMSAVTGLCVLLFEVTGKETIFNHTYQSMEIVLIFVSCVIATSVNLCSMGLIGRTSAVTYQVVGHAKTCLILVFGYIMYPSQQASGEDMVKNLFGVTVAMVGVFLYSYYQVTKQ